MKIRFWILTAMVAAVPAASMAGVIGSVDISNLGLAAQGTTPPPFAATLSISAGNVFFCAADAAGCLTMLDHTFTTADAGITYAVNAATSPDFQQIAAMLTDGLADNFSLWGPDVGFLFSVQPLFFPNGGGPDFRGFTVDEIDFTISNVSTFQVDVPAGLFDPTQGPITYTVLTQDISIAVLGAAQTPEPATAAGLVVGVAALSLRRRRRSAGSTRLTRAGGSAQR